MLMLRTIRPSIRNSLVAVAWLALGCGGSSYPSDNLQKDKQPPLPANFYIEADDVMQMNEGRPSEYSVTGVVPAPGTPVITAERLPEGATLADGKLRWTPKFNDVSLTEDQDGFRSYRVRLTLSDSHDSESYVQKSILIFVRLDPKTRTSR